eukprot:445635_1
MNLQPFKRIDKALGQYYENMGRNDYYDEDDHKKEYGKFMKFVKDEDFDEYDIQSELKIANECMYTEMDDNFPLDNDQQQNQNSSREQQIFNIIKHCYINGTPPNTNRNDNNSIQSIPNTNAIQLPQIISNSDSNDNNEQKHEDDNDVIIDMNHVTKDGNEGILNVNEIPEEKYSELIDTSNDIQQDNDPLSIFTNDDLDEIENYFATKNTKNSILNNEKQQKQSDVDARINLYDDTEDNNLFEEEDNKFDEWGDATQIDSNNLQKHIIKKQSAPHIHICTICGNENNLKKLILNDLKCLQCYHIVNPTQSEKHEIQTVFTQENKYEEDVYYDDEIVNQMNEMGYEKSIIFDAINSLPNDANVNDIVEYIKQTQENDDIEPKQINEDNDINKYKIMPIQFAHLSEFRRIDKALGQYYICCGRTDYYYSNSYGKFMKFAMENECDEDDLYSELGDDALFDECIYIDLDDQFPLLGIGASNYIDRKFQIFQTLQYCYIYGTPTPDYLKTTLNSLYLHLVSIKQYNILRRTVPLQLLDWYEDHSNYYVAFQVNNNYSNQNKSEYVVNSIQRLLNISKECILKWEHIANAIKHELYNKIADLFLHAIHSG